MKLLLFAAVLAAGSLSADTPPLPAWSVTITTSGGFTGRGAGTFTVDSDGNIGVSTTAAEVPQCTYRLTPGEMQEFERLIGAARPHRWAESYTDPSNPHGCCDMLRYDLTLRRTIGRGAAAYRTFWFSSHPPLPADLQALTTALLGSDSSSIGARYKARCASTP